MSPRSLETVVFSEDWDHQRGSESETTAPKATGVLIGANNGAQGLSPPSLGYPPLKRYLWKPNAVFSSHLYLIPFLLGHTKFLFQQKPL